MSARGRFHDVADRLSSCRTEAAVLKQFERISVVGKFVAYLMYRDLQAVYSVILKLASRSCTPPAAVKTLCNIHSLHTALLWSADPLNLSRIKPGRSVLHETDCRQNIACEGHIYTVYVLRISGTLLQISGTPTGKACRFPM